MEPGCPGKRGAGAAWGEREPFRLGVTIPSRSKERCRSLAVAIGRRVAPAAAGRGAEGEFAAWWGLDGGAPMGDRSPPQVWAAAEGRGDGLEARRSSPPDARLLVRASLTPTPTCTQFLFFLTNRELWARRGHRKGRSGLAGPQIQSGDLPAPGEGRARSCRRAALRVLPAPGCGNTSACASAPGWTGFSHWNDPPGPGGS